MSADRAQACPDCGAEVAATLVACPSCGHLTHRDRLTSLTREARDSERAGDLATALRALRDAEPLLPDGTVQKAAIQTRMAALSAAIDGRTSQGPNQARLGAGKLAGLSVVGILLFKFKSLLALLLVNGKLLLLGLTKLPTLISMLVFAKWSSASGLGFGVGFVASIYVHEIGHVAALRRYGIAASAPMFVPGLGAFVRMKQYPSNAHEEARTGLAGPAWGLGAALVALLIGRVTDSSTALAVASFGATLNLFNLVPVWQLDGARGLRALSRDERLWLAGTGFAVALAAAQWMPAAVAVAALLRAFSKNQSGSGDKAVLVSFIVLLCAHAAIVHVAR